MTKRCTHPDVQICEYAEEAVTHFFEDGQPAGTSAGTGSILNYIDVVCPACGLHRRYGRGSLPKWVVMRIQASVQELHR